MKLTDYITNQKLEISVYLDWFLAEKERFFVDEKRTQTSITRLTHFAKQGKMLRGVLVILSYQIFTKKAVTAEVLAVAVAMELTQSGALIHDDIMDQDTLRRGAATMHTQYASEGTIAEIKNPQLFGQSMGICVGDLAFFLAFELLGKTNTPGLISRYTQLLQRCISGQITDVGLGNFTVEGSKEEILQMYINKTGYYSVVLPLLLGAHLANALTFHSSLEEIGRGIGVIFQIKDDVLGLFGEEKDIGKPQGSDIRENKKTLIRQLLYANVSEAEKKQLASIFGSQQLQAAQIAFVRELYQKYAIEKQINRIILEFGAPVEKHLTLLPDSEYTKLLQDFYYYNLSRSV